MKKRLLTMLLAAVMTVSIAGCSNSGSSSDSSSSELTGWGDDGYTKEVKIDNVTLCLPEDAVESNGDNSSDNLTWYKTSFGKIALRKGDFYTGDWHSDLTAIVFADGAKSKEKILIGDEKALMYVEDFKSQPAYWLNFNSSEHCINIIILSNTSEENAKEEYEKFLKHISIDSSVPTVTTTTTETTPSARDEFNKKYGNLPTWKDVKYDPMSYIGKKFTITDATYELDDYYNYNYRDTEAKYFVFSADTTGSYSDRWYVYADRKEFDWLFKQLKERNLKGNIVVKAQFKDGTKNGLVTLVDTE